jgi:hypothetical protein
MQVIDRVSMKNPQRTLPRRVTSSSGIAMKYNKDLDRDRDGIACEKR